MPETFGLADAGIATRVSFLITGIWWLGFGLPAIGRLPKDEVKDYFESKLFWTSWKELLVVLKELGELPALRRFLSGFSGIRPGCRPSFFWQQYLVLKY